MPAVTFRSRKIERQFTKHTEAQRAYGPEVARKFVQRVLLLRAAASFEEVRRLPGLNVHPLKGDRQGQWAAKLTHRWRLIFTVEHGPPETITIEEVSHHYGD